jgi:hypothetical protein
MALFSTVVTQIFLRSTNAQTRSLSVRVWPLLVLMFTCAFFFWALENEKFSFVISAVLLSISMVTSAVLTYGWFLLVFKGFNGSEVQVGLGRHARSGRVDVNDGGEWLGPEFAIKKLAVAISVAYLLLSFTLAAFSVGAENLGLVNFACPQVGIAVLQFMAFVQPSKCLQSSLEANDLFYLLATYYRAFAAIVVFPILVQLTAIFIGPNQKLK